MSLKVLLKELNSVFNGLNMLNKDFDNFLLDAENECKNLLDAGDHKNIVLPAYDQCLKASHLFNLLDARGVISVTERQSYISRVRSLAKLCASAWMRQKAALSSA